MGRKNHNTRRLVKVDSIRSFSNSSKNQILSDRSRSMWSIFPQGSAKENMLALKNDFETLKRVCLSGNLRWPQPCGPVKSS